MCGMSAVFSALFGTPVAAAIFPLEVISIGVLYYAALVPCIFSSFIGVGIARYLGIAGEHFTVLSIPAISVSSVGWIIFLSALCAGVSIVFCLMLHWCRAHLQENISKSLCAYPGSQCYFYPSYPADRY